jgi:hypothetical protein
MLSSKGGDSVIQDRSAHAITDACPQTASRIRGVLQHFLCFHLATGVLPR